MSELEDLYQEVILHHSKSPRNFHLVEGANRMAHGNNPLCGDKLQLTLKIEDGVVTDVGFVGEGCAISTASSSVMTDVLKGKSEAEARRILAAFVAMMLDEEPEEGAPELGKLEVFAGVKRFPVRVKCAMLPWRTLESAISDHADTVSTE